MRYAPGLVRGLAIFAVVALADARLTPAQTRGGEALMKPGTIQIPKSVQAEHEEIHATLSDATKAPGRVGIAAKELATVLHPHFVREEQIALPPLGLVAVLADRRQLPVAVISKALSMTDSLRSELPQMLSGPVVGRLDRRLAGGRRGARSGVAA